MVSDEDESANLAKYLLAGDVDKTAYIIRLTGQNTGLTGLTVTETTPYTESVRNLKLFSGLKDGKQLGKTVDKLNKDKKAVFTFKDKPLKFGDKLEDQYIRLEISVTAGAISGEVHSFAIKALKDIKVSHGQAQYGAKSENLAGPTIKVHQAAVALNLTGDADLPQQIEAVADTTLLDLTMSAVRKPFNLDAIYLDISGNADFFSNSPNGDTCLIQVKADQDTELTCQTSKILVFSSIDDVSNDHKFQAIDEEGKACEGLPIGANVRIFDTTNSEWIAWQDKNPDGADFNEVFTIAGINSQAGAGHDCVIAFKGNPKIELADGFEMIYVPAMPGPGRLSFGAMTELTANVASEAEEVKVANTSGFYVGQVLKLKGYSSKGDDVSAQGGCVIKAIAGKTLTVSSCELTQDLIDYDYATVTSNALIKGHNNNAVAYANTLDIRIKPDQEEYFIIQTGLDYVSGRYGISLNSHDGIIWHDDNALMSLNSHQTIEREWVIGE